MKFRVIAPVTAVLTAAAVTIGFVDQGTAASPGADDSPACGTTVKVPTGSGTSPVEPCVPSLAHDDTSLTLVWKKPPANTNDVIDYRVYQDGRPLGLASENATQHSPAKPYVDRFYKDDTANFHVRVQQHTFRVTGLHPQTRYRFTVRAVLSGGRESAASNEVVHTTAPAATKVVDLATVATPGNLSDAKKISANTAAIQKAIDSCAAGSTSAYGCSVVVPAGQTIVTGALFLKSNMTLEVDKGGTLKGSPNASDYPLEGGYQLYNFTTNSTDDRRPPSLLNLLSKDHRNGTAAQRTGYDTTRRTFRNVRVVGEGTIDGSGWQHLSDVTDEKGAALPQYATPAGAKGTFKSFSTGVLAKSQVAAALTEYGITPAAETAREADIENLYSNRRSSLATFRGVTDMYFGGGLTLRNPAYHGVMFLESTRVVFANTVSQTFDANNADGVEFGSSQGALVFDNFFDTGDDNVNFAAGQGKTYEHAKPTEHAWVFNNYLREGHGIISLGSHTGAKIQNILAEDNVAYLTDNGMRLKSTPATGGGVNRVVFRDTAMRSIGTKGATSAAGGRTFVDGGGDGNAFILTLKYSAGSNVFANASSSAMYRDITVQNTSLDNITTAQGKAAIQIDGYAGTDTALGYPETFHHRVIFNQVRIKNAKPASISRVKKGRFTDVTVHVNNTTAPTSWWGLKDTSPGTTFTQVSPAPPAG